MGQNWPRSFKLQDLEIFELNILIQVNKQSRAIQDHISNHIFHNNVHVVM